MPQCTKPSSPSETALQVLMEWTEDQLAWQRRALALLLERREVALLLLLGACSTGAPDERTPTFADDVAAILHRECVVCHQPEGIGPFSLLTYEEARTRADRIAVATGSGVMPPWLPAAGYMAFHHERRLSDDEVRTLSRWAKAGAPGGNLGNAPPPPDRPPDGWQLGEPKLVFELPRYEVPAAGGDIYRNFVLPYEGRDTLWIGVVELRPGDLTVVHHARLMVDTTDASAELDRADPSPGFDGMGLVTAAENPQGSFVGWTPGRIASTGSVDLAWPLPPGADIVVQLHLRPAGRTVPLEPLVGLHPVDRPRGHLPSLIVLDSDEIDIPAGDPAHVIEETFRLPVAVDALGVYPHAHYLARRMEGFAILPDGSRRWLIVIDDWDFHWQDEYRFAEPVTLPAGSVLTLRYTYDNSPANPANPHDPPRRVRFGPESTDEMAELIVQVRTRREEDREVLEQAVRWMYFAKEAQRRARIEVLRGDSLASADRLDDALDAYRGALRISSDPAIMASMARVLVAKGDGAAAVLVAEQAAALAEAPSPEILATLALAYHAAGRDADAEAALLRAVEAAEQRGLMALADSLRARFVDPPPQPAEGAPPR